MIDFTLGEVAKIVNGEYHGEAGLIAARINGVTIDSRSVAAGDLFIPIVGERFDGHSFIASAASAGALAVLSQNECECCCPVILVESTSEAFRRLAGAYRARFDIPFVGITGSVGKTTTKELIHCVLSQSFNALKNEGNLNNQTGVPLTLLRLNGEHEAAVIEMGTNHFGEIASLASIVRPDIGVMTNIGESHIEYLGSREGILREKSDLLNNMRPNGIAVINGDDDMLSTLRGTYPRMLTYGMNAENDFYAENIRELGFEGTRFTARFEGGSMEALIPAPGLHMVMNALCAIAVGRALGMDKDSIIKGLVAYVPTDGRMAMLRARRLTVINDAYNASPTAMKSSIDIATKADGRTVLILGDMFELGGDELRYHSEVGEHAARAGAGLIITVGTLSRALHEGALAAGGSAVHFENKEQLIKKLQALLCDGDTVLVKASHSMHLEDVAAYIAENF